MMELNTGVFFFFSFCEGETYKTAPAPGMETDASPNQTNQTRLVNKQSSLS